METQNDGLPDELELLRQYAEDKDPYFRAPAVSELCASWPVSWEDLEKWALDTAELVRSNAIGEMESDFRPAGELCRTDKARFVALLEEAIRRYGDYAAGNALYWISAEDDEMLELTWAAAERLLSPDDVDSNTVVNVCYLEHVITDKNWGPDDPHIAPWIKGTDIVRKCMLLNVASWMGLGDGRLREITEALSRDADKDIAAGARELLARNEDKDRPHIEVKKKRKGGRKPGHPKKST